MSNIELLPCPFCGSMEVNPIWHEDDCYHRMFYEMMLPHSEVIYTEEELRKAWNTRYEPPKIELVFNYASASVLRDRRVEAAYRKGRFDEQLYQQVFANGV